MIAIKKTPIYVLKINAKSVKAFDTIRLSQYSSYQGESPFFMVKHLSNTLWIDLDQSEEELLQGCKSNTRNEIRRAVRENFFFKKIESIAEFVEFYNNFAIEKGLAIIKCNDLDKYEDHLVLYKSGKDNYTMTMHASIIDQEESKVSLLYSASVRLDEGVDNKSVGFSNRFLHFKEFLAFKEMGVKTYDFSGVCLDPSDKARYQIGLFKQSFGGELKPAIRLYSIPMSILMKIKSILY